MTSKDSPFHFSSLLQLSYHSSKHIDLGAAPTAMPPRQLDAAHAAEMADVLGAAEEVRHAAQRQEDAQQARDHVRVLAGARLRARERPVVAEWAVYRRPVPVERG